MSNSPTNPEEKINDDQKIRISGHWDSLKRFDIYIGSVNFKCGLITTLNAAVFGGVILKSKEIITIDETVSKPIATLIFLIIILSALSIIWVIRSIWPNLKSLSTSSGAPSLYFFGSISKNFSAQSFADKSHSTSIDEIERDLAIQVHEVASITSLKMRHISTASLITIANLISLLILGILVTLKSLGADLCLT